MREKIIETVLKEKVIAIVRGAAPTDCLKIADALYAGGIRMVEITFNQKDPTSFHDTATAIRTIAEAYDGRMLVGAGTVITEAQAELAASAGAGYIISPDTNPDVIRRTRELGLVSMPGALTPSEVLIAHRAGADFVKLFPVGSLGTGYIKAVSAPISHVRLLGVGGVDENNVAEFLRAGVVGVGVGGNLVNKAWIAAGEWDKITAVAEKLVAGAKSV